MQENGIIDVYRVYCNGEWQLNQCEVIHLALGRLLIDYAAHMKPHRPKSKFGIIRLSSNSFLRMIRAWSTHRSGPRSLAGFHPRERAYPPTPVRQYFLHNFDVVVTPHASPILSPLSAPDEAPLSQYEHPRTGAAYLWVLGYAKQPEHPRPTFFNLPLRRNQTIFNPGESGIGTHILFVPSLYLKWAREFVRGSRV